MGGRGSGRRGSFGLLTDRCEDYRSIDISWLKRQGLLTPGRWSTITWSRRGEPIGSIRIECLDHAARLVYRHRAGGGEWQDVSELVPLLETSTQFGGRRQWFQCPSCRRRCRILYGGAHFRCRRCHRLKYESQYEPPFARAASRVHKLRARLGNKGGLDEPFPPKPKGMHWATYDRLAAEDEALQERWATGIVGWLDRRDQR